MEQKNKKRTKILQNINNKFNEIKASLEKIKKIKNFKNEKLNFKHFIISKDNMDMFEKEELRKERKIVKNSWFDWLINYVLSLIKKLQAILKIRF